MLNLFPAPAQQFLTVSQVRAWLPDQAHGDDLKEHLQREACSKDIVCIRQCLAHLCLIEVWLVAVHSQCDTVCKNLQRTGLNEFAL